MEFVNKVARAAEAANHHPDIDIRWNKVTLALTGDQRQVREAFRRLAAAPTGRGAPL